MSSSYPKAVRIWLLVGLIMVLVQILLGGITRLTGSGLSITKWEIVTGTLPPLSNDDWVSAFSAYQKTPQYQKINAEMNIGEFRFIYLWEYVHRLWARLMGLVFFVPFLLFWRKGWIDRRLARWLAGIIFLAALVASFGWIMVASGLSERPWVNAYKLAIHLNLGLLLLSVIGWTFLSSSNIEREPVPAGIRNGIHMLLALLVVQLFIGGLMSGMKAGLFYPSWPDMNGAWIPSVLMDKGNWKLVHFIDYDQHIFASALVQFIHRLVGYTLCIAGIWLWWKVRASAMKDSLKSLSGVLIIALLTQVLLGILTVIHCKGQIPLVYGVLHQLGACFLLGILILLKFKAASE